MFDPGIYEPAEYEVCGAGGMTAYHRSRWQCWKELHALATHGEPREDQRQLEPPRERSEIIVAS